MLNNYIFFNMNNYKIELEKIEPLNMDENLLQKCIKCYTSFFPKTKVLLSPHNNHLVVIKKKVYFRSKQPFHISYCLKKKQTDISISFNIFNLSNEHLLEINISLSEEQRFNYIFSDYFIYTDFDSKFKYSSFIGEGLYVKNYKVEILENEGLKKKSFFAKVYDK